MWFKLKDMIQEYQVNPQSVAHIGAHWAEELDEYIQNGFTKIALFEPLEINLAVIRSKLAAIAAPVEVQLYATALGNEDLDEITLAVSSNDAQSSSILSPKEHLTQYPGITFPNLARSTLKRLDNMRLGRFDMLNIDVQGYELEVLRGAAETLPTVQLIVVEVNRAELYAGCPMVEDLDGYLSQFGLFRQKTDWIGGTWGDAIYTRGLPVKQRV
jgi:FkbM family methyltransferase